MRPHGPRLLLFVVLATGLSHQAAAQGQEYPTYELSFDPCPQELVLQPGSSTQLTLDCVLTASNDPQGAGAQGWNFGFELAGLRVTDITTQGTVAARSDDDPPGFVRQTGFEITDLARCGPDRFPSSPHDMGVYSAIVLSFSEPATLPPEGTFVVLRVTVLAEAPATSGESKSAGLFYVDDCVSRGSPYASAVTWRGQSVPPIQGSCEFEILAGQPVFRRGDVNDDGTADVSDVIKTLGCKFLGEACPLCRDAMDVNDDGVADISDAIRLLGFLFLGSPPPPPPGPSACGPDSTPDSLAPCAYRTCE